MKKLLTFLSFTPFYLFVAQSNTSTRDDAGLMGNQAASGFFETVDPKNYPVGADLWWHLLDVRHSNPNNNYAMQFSGSFFDQNLWFRKTNNNPSQPWRKVMLMNENGNVGIGTDNPESALEVYGGGNLSLRGATDDAGDIIFQKNTGQQMGRIWSYNLGGLFFSGSDNIPKMTLTDNGNIGIGTIEPSSKLDVRGTISVPEIAFRNTDGGDDSDPYRLRKVRNSPNENWLELQLNDDHNESFRIYGNSCLNHGCREYSSNLYHSFDTSGNVYHKGWLQTESTIESNINRAEGGAIMLTNPQKKDPSIANRWVIYNMTGGYGNSLQFWNYSLDDTMYSPRLIISDNGNMSLPTGKFEAKEVKVTTTPTADFVFAEDYQLPKLEEIEKHIRDKKHLPEIASAIQMEKDGVNIGEFQIKLLQKIEELTLYIIELNKRINELEKKNK
ncbi:hypothetical protein [Riemerella anatipestifer]|uniref:hypothetical protein n=2 Tax=Riemerella anatipestifer TaxID=34085 RepID=UPI0021A7D09D|nr:hypothetical protein [Riemerella anatipestifer]